MTLLVKIEGRYVHLILVYKKRVVQEFRYLSFKDLREGIDILKKKNGINLIVFFWPYGGKIIKKSVVTVNEKIIKKLHSAFGFDSQCNNMMLQSMKVLQKEFLNVPQKIICDTAFFLDFPEVSFLYAIPYEFSQKGIRRFGKHGVFHQWAVNRVAEESGCKYKKIISVCLDAHTNVAAIKNGKTVDVSDGFSDAGGVVSEHGCGMIDLFSVFEMVSEGMSCARIEKILSQESGLASLSLQGFHFEDIFNSPKNEHERFVKQFYQYQILKHVGAFTAVLGGLDALIFTGREYPYSKNFIKGLLKEMSFLGIKMKSISSSRESICLTQKKSQLQVFLVQKDFLKVIEDFKVLS